MKCETARERLFEVDPAELRGRRGTELSSHLAECPSCSALADTLVRELEELQSGLGAWAAAGDPEAAADAVLRSGPGAAPRRRLRAMGSGPWRPRTWIPLAAAAVLAGILLARGPEPEWTTPRPAPEAAPRVAVHPPADRRAAVLATKNPNITIVWLYQEEGT